jgi:hypothetical protein
MPKISEEELELIQVRFFKKDLDYIRRLFGNDLGVNKAIRSIVRSFVVNSRAKADKAIDEAEAGATSAAQAQTLSDLVG